MSNYQPTNPSQDYDPQWLYDELSRIATAMAQPTSLIFEETHVAPTSPKEGMEVLADGTDWNPGAGRGLYLYSGGTWNKL